MSQTQEPRWSVQVATPAAVGTPEAAAAADQPDPWQRGAQADPWQRSVQPGQVGYPTVSWATLTGQNLEGTHNAFDTSFWERAHAQDVEQQSRGMRTRWSRPDATGVVMYDDKEQGLTFGDVFLDGVKQGNLRQGYGGLDRTQGNEMLARIHPELSREVWAKAYESEAGRPATWAADLDTEVTKAAERSTEQYRMGLSAESFEEGVLERAQAYEESDAAQVTNVAAGVGGAALVGAGVGSLIAPGIGTAIGAGIGGLAGGIGAWLNRDEQFSRVAQAMEQYELARDGGTTAVGAADAVVGWAGVVGGNLSPLRNLTRGIYDAAGEGGVGDGRSRFNEEGAPGWLTALDTAALVVDGIGTFGGGLAVKAYTGVMAVTATSATTAVVAGSAHGGVGFNPYSGQYENLGAGGMAARGASAGIDWVQTAMGRGVTNIANRATGGYGREQGGYLITTATDGTRTAQRLGFSAFVPSEAATGISARMLARRDVRRSGEPMSRENLARATAKHIDELTSGRKTIATMAVNAVGEGSEEFVQVVLDAASVGVAPTLHELAEAYRQGAAMGAGMGYAVGRRSLTRSQQMRHRSELIRKLHGQEPLTDEQWRALSDTEQAMEGTTDVAEVQQLIETMTSEVLHLGQHMAAANFPEKQAAHNAMLLAAAREAKDSQATTEPSMLSLRSTDPWGPQDGVLSVTGAARMVDALVALYSQVVAGTPLRRNDGQLEEITGEHRAYAERLLPAVQALAARLRQAQAAIEADSSAEVLAREVRQLNGMLRAWWASAESDTDPGAYARRRAASLLAARFPLNSATSFQVMRLQVSEQLTRSGVHNAVLMPDEVQELIAGDYDGDRASLLIRQILPDHSYTAMRRGGSQLGGEDAGMTAKGYMVHDAALMYDALAADQGTAYHQAAVAARGRLKAALHKILARSPMARQDRVRLVDEFVERVATRRIEEAFANKEGTGLFQVLPTRYSAAMQELSETLDASPWLALSRAVEVTLKDMATEIALTDYNQLSDTGAVELPVASRNMPAFPTQGIPAVSEMLTAALETSSNDMFRLQGILKYNHIRESTDADPETITQVLDSMMRRFLALNEREVRSGDEQARETVVAQTRTLSWLRTLAAENSADLGDPTPGEALVLMAGMRVPDLTNAERAPHSKNSMTLLQAALHEVVNGLRREYADFIARDESIGRRLASLQELTRPDRQDGTHSIAAGGRAFVEVLGAQRIGELLGPAAAPIASYTVRGLRDDLRQMRPGVRTQFEQALKDHPQYHQTLQDAPYPHTPYRVLVDNVIQAARMDLHEDADGLAAGAATRPEQQARANFTTMHDTLRALAHARGAAFTTGADVRAFLASDMRRSAEILAVLESQGLQAAMTNKDARGNYTEIQFPQWFYDVLAEKQTARAEMMMLRNTLVFKRAAQLQDDMTVEVDKITDSHLRMWIDLEVRANDPANPRQTMDRIALADYQQLLFTAGSTKEYLSTLNRDPRFRRERSIPFMAWLRDREALAADMFGSGVSPVLEGQSTRDALRDAAAAAKRELQIHNDTETHIKGIAPLLHEIRTSRDGGDDPEPWRRFKLLFEQAKQLPTLISIAMSIEMAAGTNSILPGQGDKGDAPSNVAPMGKALAQQLGTFDSAIGRAFASVTSESLHTVLADMAQLAAGPRTLVLDDGTVVEWDGGSAEQALDWLGDPKTAGMAARMMGLTAWDLNTDTGVTTLSSVIGKGVAGFAMDPETGLFDATQTAKFRRLTMMEGAARKAGTPPVLPVYLAQLMNLHETGLDHVISPRSQERRQMGVRLLEQMADAYKALSTLEHLYADDNGLITTVEDTETGEQVPLLNYVLLQAGRRARRAAGSTIQRLLPDTDGPTRRVMEETLRLFIARLATRAVKSDDQAGLALARQLTREFNRLDDYSSPVHMLVDQFKHFDQPLVRQQIVDLVRSWGDMANAVPWARDDIHRLLDARTATVEMVATRNEDAGLTSQTVTLPDMTDKQWENLAGAVVAFTMHTTYSPATSSTVQVSEFPKLSDADALARELPFWDTSGAAPVLDMFVPDVLVNRSAAPTPMLQAGLDLARDLAPQLPTTSLEEAIESVYRLIAPVKVSPEGVRSGAIGPWHSLLPTQMRYATGAIVSAAAPSGVAQAGINPERMRTFAASTAMDWSRVPGEDELSGATLPADQFVNAVQAGQATTHELDLEVAEGSPTGFTRVPRAGRLMHLEGRFARTVALVAPDGTEVSLLDHPRFATGMALPGHLEGADGIGVISLETLAESVAQYLDEGRVPAEVRQGYALRLEFYHPRTKATSATRVQGDAFDHNAWFDGVSGRTVSAFHQESLLGFLYFNKDGTIPTAYTHHLDSIKKLHFALQQVTTMPEAERKKILATGLRDVDAMIESLTQFIMQQPIDGTPLATSSYNAVRKFVELLHVVRYVDESGQPKVLSIEEVSARQQRGEEFSADSLAGVVGLPTEHVLGLMGEKKLLGGRLVVDGVEDYRIDLSRAEPYLRFPQNAWADTWLGGLVRLERDENDAPVAWGTRRLEELPQMQRLEVPRTMTRHYPTTGPEQAREVFPKRMRDQQTRVLQERAQMPDAARRLGGQRQAAKQLVLQERIFNAAGQTLHGVQLNINGMYVDASEHLAGNLSTDTPSHDFTTGHVYLHNGHRRGPAISGVLVSAQEVADHTTMGDIVHLLARQFMPRGSEMVSDVWPDVRTVLDELMNTGTDIHIPSSPEAAPLVREMKQYLRQRGYATKPGSTAEFTPVMSEVEFQNEAAYNARLEVVEHRSNRNRRLIEQSDQFSAHEGSIIEMNDGVGAVDNYIVSDVVLTGQFAGYAPSLEGAQDRAVAATLLPLLRRPEGRAYLRQLAEVGTSREKLADLDVALDRLEQRMVDVQTDGSATHSLLPRPGERFGTGDIIPLVSYNMDGELIGIHLKRHGHALPKDMEVQLRGPVTAANKALGVNGVRLTSDTVELEPMHTTREGPVVDLHWVGPQGFVIELQVDLTSMGSRVVEVGSSAKWTTGELPPGFRVLSRAVLSGQPARGAGDRSTQVGKGADQYLLNAPDRIAESMGFDVLPYLVRALTGTEPTSPEYSAKALAVSQALRKFSRIHGGDAQAADLVRRNTGQLEATVAAHLQARMEELLRDEAGLTMPDLLDDSTQERLADVTMLRLTLAALSAGAHIDQLRAPGYIGVEGLAHSHLMHPVFTTLLAQLPDNHVAKAAFAAQINARLEAGGTRESNGDGYYLRPDLRSWVKQATHEDGSVERREIMLSYPVLTNSATNDALSELARPRQGRSQVSPSTQAMIRTAWGADSIVDERGMRAPEMFKRNAALHSTTPEVTQRTLNLGATASPFMARPDDDVPMDARALRHVQTRATPARQALAVRIDDTNWYKDMPKAKAERARRDFQELFDRVLGLARLEDTQQIYLVEMIRAAAVRPASLDRSDGEFLRREEAMRALRLIERNLRAHRWPLHRAGVNAISRDALFAMKDGGYVLYQNQDSHRPALTKDDWLDVMLSEVFTDDPLTRRYLATTNIIDGILFEYRKDVRGLGETISPAARAAREIAELGDSGVLISGAERRRQLSSPSVQAGRMVHDPSAFETTDIMLEELPQEARAQLDERMDSWEARNNVGDRHKIRQSPRAEAISGRTLRTGMARNNVFMRYIQMWIIGKAMANVGLHVASYLELQQRAGQEELVSFLSGQGMGGLGLTPAQKRLWRQTRDALAENPEFYGEVYENTGWNPWGDAGTRGESRVQALLNFSTAMYSDPSWGRRNKWMARVFMEAAWDRMSKSGVHVSVEQFLDTLRSNPSALESINTDAVQDGYARIEYRRNLQDNLAEQSRRKIVEGFIGSGIPGANTLGTVFLRWPTLFFRFRSNTLINLMGLQAPHAVLAQLMSDRTKRPGGLKDWLTGATEGMDPDVSEQARTEDSVDLTRAIIRTGVSHTQLFMLAGALGAAGFGGDDEEEQRRRDRIRRFQTTPVARDPMALENDFRHAQAWFIDMLPGGAGVPNWILRMFVSPAMGIARFQETGDFRNVVWGFEDALGSMPLLNLDTVRNSWNIATELQAAAEAEAVEDSVEANARAMRLMITAVGTMENILLESAFASMIYQGADDWDRDPYAIPDTDELGRIRREGAYGTPVRTDALQDIHDGERFGEKGYVTRGDFDAAVRGMAENRPMLAYLLRAIRNDSTYLRQNMVPKMRTARAEELGIDEAEMLIMSIVNNELGGEELTIDGAEAVVRGINLGTVKMDSPALTGVFIPRAMRQELHTRFLEDLTVKYLELGLPKARALSAAKEEYYGQAFGEPEGLGLADILWGDHIPEFQNQRYMQLNTSYMLGPNNRPVATGLTRSMLSAFGLNVFETYHAGQNSNMPVDPLLNSVDAVRGVNLGLRGLVKVDESWIPPTPEDLAENIERALDRISDQIGDVTDQFGSQPFRPRWGSSGGWSRGGGFGGGYSYSGTGYAQSYGGQALRLSAPRRVRSPNADDLYSINTSNPIIRRATIRRERFASQRGRLNQWQ